MAPVPRHPLFRKELLQAFLSQQSAPLPMSEAALVEKLLSWKGTLGNGALTESNLEQAFNQLFFVEILGYAQPPGASNYFTFLPKSKATGGDGFPDFLLGKFKLGPNGDLEEDVRLSVGELKGPPTDLDKVDPSRMKSPVEQAFEYAIRNGLNVKWVIVSNMKEVRLYHHSAIDHYERWAVEEFVRDGALTAEFWSFFHLLRRDSLLGYPEPSSLENLIRNSLSARLRLTDDFYAYYRQIVKDVFSALAQRHAEKAASSDGRIQLIRAAQLLIHRALVTCFFSDHPARLLPPRLLAEVVESAKNRPSRSTEKIYEAVKDLFHTIDAGTPAGSAVHVFGYNGGLFHPHPLLDETRLPDELFTREYKVGEDRVSGVFGFTKYDFYTDLNEHLLGRIFEESVGDFQRIHETAGNSLSAFENSLTREKYGLFYTREGLTNFLGERALQELFRARRTAVWDRVIGTKKEKPTKTEEEAYFKAYLESLLSVRVVDLSCGSGAFLVSCYRALVREINRIVSRLNAAKGGQGQLTLLDFHEIEADALRQCIHGNDILPESVEVAKLSLWIASARKEMKLKGLETNFLAADSLSAALPFQNVPAGSDGFPQFDLVIGNPPWGAAVQPASRQYVQSLYPDIDCETLDSYELFILLGMKYLAPGGSLAYVLPHTLLLEDHRPVRQFLVEHTTVVRYHNLGAEWFGPEVRMNTTLLHIRKAKPTSASTFRSMTLVDEDRRRAVLGDTNLSQLEESYSFPIPQSRCAKSGEIELFRYSEDDAVMSTMESNSLPFGVMMDSYRGVELGKEGHIIRCPDCAKWDSPPDIQKGGKWKPKTCNHCGHTYEITAALEQQRIVHSSPSAGDTPYVDGDSFRGRYAPLEYRGIRTGFDGINYKKPEIYEKEKILIRQAGVGIAAALDSSGALCPQSVYLYRLKASADDVRKAAEKEKAPGNWMPIQALPEGVPETIDHRFILALLNSRVLNYYVFKRFGEIDAAQAFAKMTHAKLRTLPIPLKALSTEAGKKAYATILEKVATIQSAGSVRSVLQEDYAIDRALRTLFGLDQIARDHLMGQLGLVAYHKVMQELFPISAPPRPQRRIPVSLAKTA